jgi:anaphase-promoting complex subunit 6
VRYLRSTTTLHDTDWLVEWEFVQSLAYKEQTPEDAEFVRLVYTSRLRKYKHAEEHALARKRLVKEFGLSDNPDVLFSFADTLYAQFRWLDCYAITSRCDLSSCRFD